MCVPVFCPFCGFGYVSSNDGEKHGYVDDFIVSYVPEPSTLVLLATGLMGLLYYARRKRK